MPTTKRESQPKLQESLCVADVRTGHTVADLKQSFLDNLFCGLGRVPMAATRNDAYTALALTVRDRVFKQGVRTMQIYAEQDARVARMGKFSSDRSIRDYCERVWKVKSVPVRNTST